jgi:hypothetical protein
MATVLAEFKRLHGRNLRHHHHHHHHHHPHNAAASAAARDDESEKDVVVTDTEAYFAAVMLQDWVRRGYRRVSVLQHLTEWLAETRYARMPTAQELMHAVMTD